MEPLAVFSVKEGGCDMVVVSVAVVANNSYSYNYTVYWYTNIILEKKCVVHLYCAFWIMGILC